MDISKVSLALVGATGAVGTEVLKILAERNFPVGQLRLFAGDRSAGTSLTYKNRSYPIEHATQTDAEEKFRGVDMAIFSAGAGVSKSYAWLIANNGTVVIDNSTTYRMNPEVPLVVPEINVHALAKYRANRIVANPNCTTAIAMMALAPLHRQFGLTGVIGATYQAVSGIGRKGLEELRNQQYQLGQFQDIETEVFQHQIVDNVIPQVDHLNSDLYTVEEAKMTYEGRKILEHPNLNTSITCVRVPVPRAHSMALTALFEVDVSPGDARQCLSHAAGIEVVDNPHKGLYPMPLRASGKDKVQVGRIRRDSALPNALSLFICGDQLRKGAALNAVQIAEELLKIM